MMTVTNATHDPLSITSVHVNVKGHNADQVFKFLAWEIARSSGLKAIEIYDRFEDFTRRHSPAIGDGVAVFDWKHELLDKPVLVYAQLETPCRIGTDEERPVDILALLISPESEGPLHLRRLARFTRLFRDLELLARLRDVTSEDGAKAVLDSAMAQVIAPSVQQAA